LFRDLYDYFPTIFMAPILLRQQPYLWCWRTARV